MNTEQLTEVVDDVPCTVEIGQTQVLRSFMFDSLHEDRQNSENQSGPNLELENMRQESEYLYQDNQKVQQKMLLLEKENDKLKENVAKLHAELSVAEQRESFRRSADDQKEQENKNLIEKLNLLCEENANLKQKLGEFNTMKRLKEKVVTELANRDAEIRIYVGIMKEHEHIEEVCKQQIEALEQESLELSTRCSESEMAAEALQEEVYRLRTQLQQFTVVFDMKDAQWKRESQINMKLKRKLSILMGDNPLCQENNQSKHRFELRKSYLPECVRCKSCLVKNESNNEECKYHPQKPLPYRSWVGMFPEDSIVNKSSKNMYWPCCRQFSTIEPEGCTSQPHHLIQIPADVLGGYVT